MFCDKATFHPSGKVNRHNVRIWGTENPHKIIEHVQDSPKWHVFWAVISVKVRGPFFFAEPTVTGISYLDMLENYIMPQQQQDMDRDFIFQQGGAPPTLPLRGYFLPQSHSCCSYWTWWNDSLATTITWLKYPWTFHCGDTLKTKFLFHHFLQLWKNYRHR